MEELVEFLKSVLENGAGRIVLFLLILVLTFILLKVFRTLLARYIQSSTEVMKNDATNYKFLRHLGSAIIIIVGLGVAVSVIPSLRALSSSLLAGAGIFAIAFGFAAQSAFANIIGGLFIVMFKPFRVHDRLDIDDISGFVEDITLRHTVIRNFENQRVVIPNSLISEKIVINSDLVDAKVSKAVIVLIDYTTDMDVAIGIMQEEIRKHPEFEDTRSGEDIENGVIDIKVRVIDLGVDAVSLKTWVTGENASAAFFFKCDVLKAIKERFDAAGFKHPYVYRHIIGSGEA